MDQSIKRHTPEYEAAIVSNCQEKSSRLGEGKLGFAAQNAVSINYS